MKTTDEYLLIKQAAELLGVSANTLRAWVSTGKIQAYRHPVNNYRLFKKSEVDALLALIENPQPVSLPAHKAK
jgi:excisionase family DNA binding protein